MMNENLYNAVLNTNYDHDDCDEVTGYNIGCPTIKELIEILNKFPEDWRITCCGAENYLYAFPQDGHITIDNESYICL